MKFFNKDNKDKVDDKFDIDAILDMEQFDYGSPDMQDDRKPVVRLASGLYKGATEGVRDSGFIHDLVKDILPTGYGQTMDAAVTVKEGVKDLYDEASRELKPVSKQLKGFLVRNIPQDHKLVPESIQKLLKEWSDEQDEELNKRNYQVNKEETRQLETTRTLGDLFGQMEAEAQSRHEESQADSRLKTVIGKNQNRDLLQGLGDISYGVAQSNRFWTRMMMPVQKKQIELQLRQLFAVQDSLEFLRQDAQRRDQHLANITKNTALPEFVKIGKAENLHQVMRNKFFDTVNNGLFGDRGQFIENMMAKAREKVVTGAKDLARGAAMGLAGGSMAQSALQGEDKYVKGGEVLGRSMGQGGVSYFANEYKDKLQNSKLAQRFGLQERGDKLETFMGSIPQQVEEFRRSDKWDYDNSLKGSVMRGIQSLVPSTSASMVADQVNVRQLDAPYHFTRRTDRTINEIIPGWLARIHQSAEGIRTGSEAELMEYDHRNQRFGLKSMVRKVAKESIFNPAGVRDTQARMKRFTDSLDPEGKLSPEARSALEKRLLQSSARGRQANEKNLGNVRAFEGGDAKSNREAADFMREYLSKMSPRQQAELTKMHRESVNDIKETRGAIQQEIILGNTDWLREEGLLDKTGRQMNMDTILEGYLDKANTTNADDYPALSKRASPIEQAARHAANVLKAKTGQKFKSLKEGFESAWVDSPAHEAAKDIRDKAAPLWDPLKNKATVAMKDVQGKAQDLTDALRARGYQYSAAPPSFGFTAPSFTKPASASSPEATAPEKKSHSFNTAFTPSPTPQPAPQSQAPGGFAQSAQNVLGKMNGWASDNYQAGKENLKGYAHVWKARDPGEQMQDDLDTLRTKAEGEAQSAGKKAHKGFQDAVKGMRNAFMDVESDLYVSGEQNPRILAAKLQEGKYLDKDTGKVIRRISDIKGDVIDDQNNTVLERDEISALMKFSQKLGTFVPAFRGSGFLGSLVGGVGRLLWAYQTKVAPKWVAFNYRMLKGAITGAAKMGKAVFQRIRGTNVRDVYVIGEQEPRLKAAKLQAGYYTHRKDGSQVFNQNDIKGELVDENGKTVIAEDELDKLQVYHSVFRVFNPLKLIPWAGKKIFAGAKWLATTAAMAATKLMWKGLKLATTGAYKVAAKVLNPSWEPTDVYVKGQNTPSLLGKLMEQGKYVSRLTRKLITRPHDIDGDVLDEKGRIVLSEAEIKAGITNPMGKTLSTKLTSKIRAGLGMLKRAISVRVGLETPGLRRQQAMARNAQDPDKKPPSFLDKIMGKSGNGEGSANDKEGFTKPSIFNKLTPAEQQVSLLKDLLGIFKRQERASTKKKVLGDNGQGLRKGGWQEQLQKRGEKKKAAEANKGNKKDDHKSGFGAFMKGLGSLFGKKGEEGGGGMGMLGLLGRGLFGAGGGAAAAGTAAAGTAAAGAATAATAGTAAAGVGAVGAAGAAAGAAGGVAIAPILLGTAALAGLGYATYKGFQWLSTISMTDMEKVRYAQYGFSLKQQKYSNAILGLEMDLAKVASRGPEGVKLDDAKIGLEKLMDRFGLDVKNNVHVSRFQSWYKDRFKPVYLVHLNAIHALKSSFDLAAVNKLKKEEQLKYLDATKYPSGPYEMKILPLDEKSYPTSGAKEYNDIFKATYEDIRGTKEDTDPKQAKIDSQDKKKEQFRQTPKFIPMDPKKREEAEMKSQARARETAAAQMAKMSSKTIGSNPDGEDVSQGEGGGGQAGRTMNTAYQGRANPGMPPMADGQISDGRQADQYLVPRKNAVIDKMNPQLLTNLRGMAQEYGELTGKQLPVNNAWRSYAMQAALKQKLGAQAATPGKSLHEFGLAFDIDRGIAGELEKMGLMKKYGFTRPVGQEPWHVEPAGIQGDIDRYRNDPNAAQEAIQAGLGRGGGGYGMDPRSGQYKRNPSLANALFAMGASPTVENKADKPEPGMEGLIKTGGSATATIASLSPDGQIPTPSGAPSGTSTPGAQNVNPANGMVPAVQSLGEGESIDAESAPMSTGGQGSAATQTLQSRGRKMSRADIAHSAMSDPTAKVPQPQGSGYQAVKDTIVQAAKATGEDADTMIKVAAVESGFNPKAKASTSSASGLYQFINGTWQETVGKYGQRYGIDRNTSPMDARANALMAGHYLGNIRKTLQPVLGRKPTAAEVYMGHFLGPGGARQFFSAMKANPNGAAAQAMPKAAKANRGIFFRGNQALPFTEVFRGLEMKINTRAQQFGVPASPSSAPPGTPVEQGSVVAGSSPGGGFESSGSQGFDSGSSQAGWDSSTNVPAPDTGATYNPAKDKLKSIEELNQPRPRGPAALAKAQATQQAEQNPMSGMFGFMHPEPMQQVVSRQTPQFNPADLFGNTEKLLGQQVEIQEKILKILEAKAKEGAKEKPASEDKGNAVEAEAKQAVSKRPRAEPLQVRNTPVSTMRSI